MSLPILANDTAIGLAGLFILVGALHMLAPYFLREAYRRWAFGSGFYYVVGTAQLMAGLFLAVPQTRIWGGLLAGAILFITVVSLLNHRKYLYAIPAILAMVAIAPTMVAPL